MVYLLISTTLMIQPKENVFFSRGVDRLLTFGSGGGPDAPINPSEPGIVVFGSNLRNCANINPRGFHRLLEAVGNQALSPNET